VLAQMQCVKLCLIVSKYATKGGCFRADNSRSQQYNRTEKGYKFQEGIMLC
jgi:predicted transcriptional regulator